jgi:hypothetical protein
MPFKDVGHTLQATAHLREVRVRVDESVFKKRAIHFAAKADVKPPHLTTLSLEEVVKVLGMTTRSAVPVADVARACPDLEIGTN